MPETTLIQVSEHVYWMTPGKPDRPSLAAVVGRDFTLMLDAGASAAHARLFLDALKDAGIAAPRYVALTHWHWDHVFGAKAIGAPVIADARTRDQLRVLAGYDWSDAALDARVQTGEEIVFCADNIKIELPNPRTIEFLMPEIVLTAEIELSLGDLTCQIVHVGGDHADDSCVMYIPQDRVLFLGDCWYPAIYAPAWYYTPDRTLRLLDTLSQFDAETYIEGHGDALLTRAEFDALTGQMRAVANLSRDISLDEAGMLAALKNAGHTIDDDLTELVQTFIEGRKYTSTGANG